MQKNYNKLFLFELFISYERLMFYVFIICGWSVFFQKINKNKVIKIMRGNFLLQKLV